MKTQTLDLLSHGHSLEKASPWQRFFDSVAIVLAGACGIHCLLVPAAMVVFPILGSSFLNDERFHLWMLAFVLPTTAVAVFLGCRKHKDAFVIGLSATGLVLLTIAAFWGLGDAHSHAHHVGAADHHHHGHGHLWGTWLSVAGGALLVSAHVRNYRRCRQARCSH